MPRERDPGFTPGPAPQSPVAARKLNPTDATLWDIERNPRLRTTIVVACLLDQPVDPDRLANDLEGATRVLPRLRERIVTPPGGVGTPYWALDEAFDITRHLRFIEADGDHVHAVVDEAESMASTDLPRDRALWECAYVGSAGAGALVLKVHHTLTDGIGGVELLDTLLDTQRNAEPRDLSRLPIPRGGRLTALVLDELGHAAEHAVQAPLDAVATTTAAITHPLQTASGTLSGALSAARLLTPSRSPASPLRGRSVHRNVRMTTVPFDRLRGAARARQCTVNHLFLAGVLGGITAYHDLMDLELDQLRVAMPVSLRQAHDADAGNQWAPVRFTVPATVADPMERVEVVRAITRTARDEPALGFSQSLAGLVHLLPPVLSSAVIGSMMQGVDATLTNIPGLPDDRFIAGAQVTRMFAFAPTGGSALNVSLLSHGETACIGLVTDTAAITSPDLLSLLVEEHLAATLDAAERAPSDPAEPSRVPPAAASPAAPERLSAVDTAFLRIETPDVPMQIGGVFIVEGTPLRDAEGAIRITDIRSHVEARLAQLPRFVRKLSEVPFGIGRPLWVDDPHFDIADHVRFTSTTEGGSRQDLLDLCASLHRQPLDRSRPLWELWFVDGLADGRVGIVEKVHHSLIDGVSGVELAAALFGFEPDTTLDTPRPRRTAPGPGPIRRVADALAEQASRPVVVARDTIRSALTNPRDVAARARDLTAAGRALARESRRAGRAPFNAAFDDRRALRSVTLDVEALHETGAAVGATVNDVVLAGVSGALHGWLRAEGEGAQDIHAMVPVSTRTAEMNAEPGNRVGAMLVALPVEEADPLRRLTLVSSRMQRLKAAHEGEASAAALHSMDLLPAPMISAITRLVSLQHLANLVVTNVPGPEEPLYFLGARVEELVPVVPLSPGMGLGVAVVSYAGDLTVALFANPTVCPNLDVLAELIEKEFARLAVAAASS